MSGVKHTPWEEVETESSVDLEGCSGWQDIADQSGRTVAIAIGWDGWRDADLDRRARLIAAAPDLLEAGAELQAARKVQNADPSAEFNITALASSSGDHAELADQAKRDIEWSCLTTVRPSVLLEILAENAALRSSLMKANDGFEEYERKFYLEQDAREEAERKLAEADGLMIELADAPQPKDTGGRFFRAMSSINAYVARLNASKEAERG